MSFPLNPVKRNTLKSTLEQLRKAELVSLIIQMVSHSPDLLDVLSSSPCNKPVIALKPTMIRERVIKAMLCYDYDGWKTSYAGISELESLLDIAGEFVRCHQWDQAATVYQITSRGILSQYKAIYDQDGLLDHILYQAAVGLAQCLPEIEESEREVILQTLFDIYHWDVEYGGIGITPELIIKDTTAEEAKELIGWAVYASTKIDKWKQRQLSDFVSLAEEISQQPTLEEVESPASQINKQAQGFMPLSDELKAAEERFARQQTLKHYQALKKLASEQGLWQQLSPKIMRALADTTDSPLLTEIYLAENELEQALDVWHKSEDSWMWSSDLILNLAQKAEKSHPRQAIRLYIERTNSLIEARGRQNYAKAATYLIRVQKLYQQLDEEESWQTLLTHISQKYHRLRALKDELKKAGLAYV